MKSIVTVLITSIICLNSFGQAQGKISGSVSDISGGAIGGSAVYLLAADSNIIKTSLSAKDGSFLFEGLEAGEYRLKISAQGHEEKISEILTLLDGQDLVAGNLKIEPITKSLKSVVVTSKKPMFEVKADKTIMNVDAAISNTGAYALEVLEKAPGVSIDKDGNISLKGKQGVIILIDGKQTYLSGNELANFLRNMPASNLEQVEIMTNPSAKYDAAGNSGIINIRTKKQKQRGFNGSANVAYGQGFYHRLNNSLSLNYRKNKVNMFATLSANTRKSRRILEINRKYMSPAEIMTAEFEQMSREVKENENFNAKVGMDYFVSKRTTLGFVLTGYTVPGRKRGSNTSFLKDGQDNVDSIVYSINDENTSWKHLAANINFRHQFDSMGQEITADIDYLTYKSGNSQMFSNDIYNADWVKRYGDQLFGELPSKIDIYTGKIDYTKPLVKNLKLEAGYKYSGVKTDNIADYFSIVSGEKQVDYEKTNRFAYEEFIHAGYVNLNKEWKKWSVQAGFRVESTEYSGHQFGNPMKPDSAFKTSYTSAFPTLYIGYKAAKNHNFTMSYGRRINRPDYEDLNPFLFFIDKYTFGSGNPYLKPMYSDVAEFSHTFKNWLTTSLNYTYTQDLFNEVFEERGYATLLKQGNFGRAHNSSVSVNATFDAKKWWKVNLYNEATYVDYTGTVAGSPVKSHGGTYLFNVQNNLTLKKGWGAELSGFYRSSAVHGQMRIKPIGMVNAGVQKQVLKNKGVIKFNVRDIFLTMPPRGNINFQSTRAAFKQTNDSRVATLSFQYRFGKPIKGVSKRKTGGASEEQSRVKGSGS